jgi:hypothetical protein
MLLSQIRANSLRIEYPGEIYHITYRSNARSLVFPSSSSHGILGSKEFIEKLKPSLRDKSKIKEIPPAP